MCRFGIKLEPIKVLNLFVRQLFQFDTSGQTLFLALEAKEKLVKP